MCILQHILMTRVRLFWLKRVSRNHFTPLCVFGKHRKFGQTEINFRVDRKITHLAFKTISGFILPSNQLHSSHTLKLLTRTPHRHSPSSIVTELHRARHTKRWVSTDWASVRWPIVCQPTLQKIHTRRERELKHTPPKEPKHILTGQIAILVQTHPCRWCLEPPLNTWPCRRMQATLPTHPLSSSSVDPSLILTDPSPSLVRTNPYLQIKFYGLKSHRQT